MADDSSRGSSTFSRRVAPFAPLAIALLMSRAVLPGREGKLAESATPNDVEAARCDDVLDFQDCHTRFPTGCSASAGYDPYLTLLKNQLPPPSLASGASVLKQDNFQDSDRRTPPALDKSNRLDHKDELEVVLLEETDATCQ